MCKTYLLGGVRSIVMHFLKQASGYWSCAEYENHMQVERNYHNDESVGVLNCGKSCTRTYLGNLDFERTIPDCVF